MIDGGPLNGGFSAILVIDDQASFARAVQDRLKPVIGVTTVDERFGQVDLQLVHSEHGRLSQLLLESECIGAAFLPLLILRRRNDTPADAAPQAIG